MDPKRRFVKLKTKEVSLVDTPAIEVEFAVIKNDDTEDDDMAGAASATEQTTDDAQRVPVEVDGGEAVVDALKHVNAIVERIENIAKGANTQTEPAAEPATEEKPEETETEKALTVQGLLEAAGLKDDVLKSALASVEKAGHKADSQIGSGAKAEETTTEKADEEPAEDEDPPMTLQSFADTVQKAARFTPGRVQKLKEAADILKLIIEGIAPNQSPATRVPTVGQHSEGNATRAALAGADPQPVMKASDTIEALKGLTGVLKALDERVESIEKARNGSNSADEEADTSESDADVKKTLWTGVL